LALGRQSSLPVIRWASIVYIEVIRGVPLVTVLFMASLMLPLFLPGGWRVDHVVRAITAFTLFSCSRGRPPSSSPTATGRSSQRAIRVIENPKWGGPAREMLLFVALVYWLFTYFMSHMSRRLERALGVGER